MSTSEGAAKSPAELGGSTYYPPPPPAPPSTQNAMGAGPQQHRPPPPQAAYHGQQQATQDQPGATHGSVQLEEHKPHVSQQQMPYFPPPPPPPAKLDEKPPNQQPTPYFPPPPTQSDDKTSQQQHGLPSYSIPQYDPSHPVFAPPPNDPGSGSSQASAPHITSASSQSQQVQPQHQPGAETDQDHKKSSWSGRFKSILSAGAAAPINSLAHKLGSQSFLPETLDKECDKAATILRSFCAKGVYADPAAGNLPTSTDPRAQESSGTAIDPTREKPKSRVIVTIPPKVISKAVGLAIFTTLRAGFQVSGATGSGVLIARLPDGSWSPPSGIQVHSLGGGFSIGVDIYDCVCVINSQEALAAFMNTRVSLGSDLAVVAGPYGAGGAVDFGTAVQRGRDDAGKKTNASGVASGLPQQTSVPGGAGSPDGERPDALKPGVSDSKRRSPSASAFKPVFSYVKSRGFYAGIQIDGTVVVERKEANAAFYGAVVTVQQILQGQVPARGAPNMMPSGARGLLETLKGAEAGALAHHHQEVSNLQDTHANATSVAAGTPPLGSSVSVGSPSGAPPAYVDDGKHARVGDVKYA